MITHYLNNLNPAIRAGLNYQRAIDGKINIFEHAMQAALAAGRQESAKINPKRHLRRIPGRTPRIGIPVASRAATAVQAVAGPSGYPTVHSSDTT